MRSLRLWAGLLVAMLAIDALLSLAIWIHFREMMDTLAKLAAPSDQSDPASMTSALTAASYLNLAAAAALWCVWQWNAAANVRDRALVAGAQPLRFTPAWNIGWWFVPVMNLWQPLRATTELWDRSHAIDGRTRPRHWILWIWWSLLLSPLVVQPGIHLYLQHWARDATANKATPQDIADVTTTVVLWLTLRSVALAALAVVVVLGITAAQDRLPPIDEDAVPA
jgi:hypothetical protein